MGLFSGWFKKKDGLSQKVMDDGYKAGQKFSDECLKAWDADFIEMSANAPRYSDNPESLGMMSLGWMMKLHNDVLEMNETMGFSDEKFGILWESLVIR